MNANLKDTRRWDLRKGVEHGGMAFEIGVSNNDGVFGSINREENGFNSNATDFCY
jgi:hypothetical protein